METGKNISSEPAGTRQVSDSGVSFCFILKTMQQFMMISCRKKERKNKTTKIRSRFRRFKFTGLILEVISVL